jgi:hypothetical protein
VVEGEVDHRVGVAGRLGEPLEVVERAVQHVRAFRGEHRRLLLRARKAKHLVPGAE